MRGLACSLALCALTPAVAAAAQPAATTAAASWSIQASPNVLPGTNRLAHVAATSAASAWAVGSQPAGSTDRTLVLYYH